MHMPIYLRVVFVSLMLLPSSCSDWLGKKEHASSRRAMEISGQSDGEGESDSSVNSEGPIENPFSELSADQCQGVETKAAAPSGLYRMTKQEYATLVSDLFGLSPDLVAGTLPDDMAANGYDNQTLSQSVHYATVSAYRDSAKAVITHLKSQVNPLAKWFPCDLDTTSSCVDAGLLAMATEIFHHIPTAIDLQSYKELFQVGLDLEGNSNAQAALLVLEGMLQSPNFLYRVELGTKEANSMLVSLTPQEIANRLASTLWMSKPDQMLLEAAKQNKLNSKEDILKVARVMLDDEKAITNMEHFFRQWFHIDRLGFHSNTMPEFNESLRNDMMQEMRLLTNHYAWTADADFLDLYTSPFSFLNTALADLYQTDSAGLTASSYTKTSYPAEGSRAGILGTAGFLTLSSKPDRVSIIHRGAFVRKFLLCDTLGAPPPEVEAMGASANESEEMQHANNPQCAACHRLIDSVGLGLNHYDAMGRLRNLPAQGHIWYATGNKDFSGSLELGQLLKEDPKAGSCVAQQLFRYLLRRAPNPQVKADACFIANVVAAGKASRHSFREYMLAVVSSDAFRMKLDQ